jgi:hypothetical protein
VLSLGMAAKYRGSSGEQLATPFYPSLEQHGIRFWRSQCVLIVGPGSAGKSLLISNLVAKWGRSCLAFLLDQDQATAAARFAATELNLPFLDLKKELDSPRVIEALTAMNAVQADFTAEAFDDITLQLRAYIERYGVPPEILVVDNLGNMSTGFDDEWNVLKALTLELDKLARTYEMLVIGAAHTKDAPTTEPMPRKDVLGQLHQYPRLILSVAYNDFDKVYKLAAVKNSSGPTDPTAARPVAFAADPGNMQVTDLRGITVGNRAAQAMEAYKLRVVTNGRSD